MDTRTPDQHADQGHWQYTLHIPHDARAIGVARSTLHAVLVRHGLAELQDTASLLASELLTNAFLHSGGPASLRLRWNQDNLRLGVWDTDPRPPVRCPYELGDVDHESGRGLLLVTVYADAWGWFPLGDEVFGAQGKYVWCELRRKRGPGGWAIAA